MKVTIIAPSSFGYIDFLIDELRQRKNVDVAHINFSAFKYQYKSIFDKVQNSVRKIILNQNVKDGHRSRCILERIEVNGTQDYIVVIRPDQIETSTLKALKKYTSKFYTFYFDAIANFPTKIDLIPLFDKVYSYEKDDVDRYNLNFITNYIYDFDHSNQIDNKVFNISSYDERFGSLKKIATYLKSNNINYNIIVRKEHGYKDDLIEIIEEYLPLEKVKKLILKTEIILDIQKKDQKGLSFRVFESLGYHKKLITTNEDVKNYDFFNPNNILIIDPDNINIPLKFLNSGYETISEDVLFPYTLKGWINNIFGI